MQGLIRSIPDLLIIIRSSPFGPPAAPTADGRYLPPSEGFCKISREYVSCRTESRCRQHNHISWYGWKMRGGGPTDLGVGARCSGDDVSCDEGGCQHVGEGERERASGVEGVWVGKLNEAGKRVTGRVVGRGVRGCGAGRCWSSWQDSCWFLMK